MQGLYPIVDLDALARRGIDPLKFAEHVLVARPSLLQLRAKHQAASSVLALLRSLRPMCHAAGSWLFANDRPDLALLADTDGVHLGQDDLPIEELRRFAPKLRVGISTHDLMQLERALEYHPDYVAFGPIFPTPSKQRPDPVVGLEGLRQAAVASQRAGVPLVAIGGIDLERASEIRAVGALAAVIGALISDSLEEVSRRALELQAKLTLTLV
jgi:thiamine-phosphate pyrophosphorylase